jgi:hypothetical protein
MQPGGVAPKQIAIDAFIAVIEDARVATALGFGSAVSAAREASRAGAALYQATATRSALSQAATTAAHVSAELEVDRWRQYIAVHSAIALEGALVVFNSVDLALKHYVRNRYGTGDRRWILGGPSYGPTPRTLFEIVRALCNYFRHRDEWLVGQGLRQAARSTAVLNDLGINPSSASTHLAVLALLPFDTWLDLESVIVSAVSNIP